MQPGHVHLKQYTRFSNFGDMIGRYLLERLWTGEIVVSNRPTAGRRNLLIVGSILQHADPWSYVCGAGAISPHAVPLTVRKVLATRGPLTDGAFEAAGLPRAEVNGDPGYLLPEFFSPKISVTHEIGAVIHYADAVGSIKQRLAEEGIKFIDVLSPVEQVASEIASCATIVSSSLHGLIVGDAYGKPTAWLKLGDRLFGGDFKFRDYFQSQNLPEKFAEPICDLSSFRAAAKRAFVKPRGIDTPAFLAQLKEGIASVAS